MTQRIIEYEPVTEEVTSGVTSGVTSLNEVQYEASADNAKNRQITKNKHLRRMSVATGITIDETNDSCQGFKTYITSIIMFLEWMAVMVIIVVLLQQIQKLI